MKRSRLLTLSPILTSVLLLGSASLGADFSLIISEFMASNDTTLDDEDGSSSDWVEIFNSGTTDGNLDGWCLTDSNSDLSKWIFPPTPIPSGSSLIVFASGKDRRISGRELHTNFKLSSGGGYLALVKPDRTSVASEYAPEYPDQLTDISYGLTMSVSRSTFVTSNALSDILIPAGNSLGDTWMQGGFSPGAGWISGSASVGFDIGASPVSGLVAHWSLDEQIGVSEISDVSGGNHHGLATSGATLGGDGATNTTATSASFSTGSINVPYDAALNPSAFTVTAWARPTGGDGYRSVITSRKDASGTHGYIIYLDFAGKWQFWTGSGGGTWDVLDGPTAAMGQWTHLAISFDPATQTKTLYINSTPYDSVTDQGYAPNDDRLLHIGAGGDYGTQYYFTGDIDDAAVFDTVLDSAEILQIMGNSIPESGMVDYAAILTTDLETSMHGVNSSVYLRIPFQASDTAGLEKLTLRMKYDDGFAAYLNGTQIATYNAPSPLEYNSSATYKNPDRDAVLFEEFDVSGHLGALQDGANILAIHGLNFDVSNEDFLIVPELTASTVPLFDPAHAGYFIAPTPGERNTLTSDTLGPLISEAGHSPLEPLSTEGLVVTGIVAQTFHPVSSVTLHYRARYNSESTLAMLDNGTGSDAVAGDGIYTAVIPAGVATSGEMLRYYITADDTQANAMRAPRITDTEGSAQSPEYYGTRVQDPSVTSGLPIFYWWTQNTYAARTRAGTRCSVFYNGEFYDNVFVRVRGQATNGNSQKFVFDKSHRFLANSTLGRVREINMNAQGADPSFIRQTLAFQLFAESGTPSCESFLTLMRINGGSDRVGILIEQVDDEFLERYGLDERSTLYKGVQKANLNPCLSEQPDGIEKKIPADDTDFSDLQDLIDGLALVPAAERRAFLFDNFNVPEMISYLAARAVIQDTDDIRKNYYICRDTYGSGEWRIFPWDKDFTFGIWGDARTYAEHPFLGDYDHKKKNAAQWNMLFELFYNQPEALEMFRRRTRTIMDTYLLPPGSPAGTSWLDQRAAALFTPADPHPGPSTSSYNGVINFLARKRTTLYVTHHENNLPGDVAGIPDAQPAQIAIQFGSYEKSPASGNQDEEYVELVNPNAIAVDVSGWSIRGGIEFAFAPGTVIPAGQSLYVSPSTKSFRLRSSAPTGGQGLFVVGGYKGHLSDLGEHLILCNAEKQSVDELLYSGSPSAAQSALRISEIMYAPRLPLSGTIPARDFEYIEIKNTGVVGVDLTGVHFSEGVEFTFTGGTLAPGALAVVTRTPVVFATRYNTNGLFLAGPYTGSLDNGGEAITLKDSLEQTVASFTYNSGRGWPLSPAGAGHALVPLIDGGIKGSLLDHPTSWRAGTYRDGSPGYDDPQPFSDLLINEIAAHTDFSDPAYPEYDSNDWLELFNATPVDESLHNWYLSDDAADLKKWAIPSSLTLLGGGWIVFDEVSGFHSPITSGFGLNKAGEQVFLSYLPGTAADRVADAVRFAGQENGRSHSRFSDGQPYWFDTTPTPLVANQRPSPGVVIRRVMYNPAPLTGSCENNTDHEYIEVLNASASSIPLWNADGSWRINGTIDFTFPPSLNLSSLANMVIVPFDPITNLTARSAFLTAHGMTDGTVNLVGPFEGSLDNRNGRITLEKPQAPDIPGDPISWVTVDEVIYFDSAPWPEGADGTGVPLERIQADRSGCDPGNWRASDTLPSMVDLDLDGLPDLWETTWFGGIHISPYGHGDSDPFSNLDEYTTGTDPTNAASYFYVEIDHNGIVPVVQFTTRSASGPGYEGLTRSYTLEGATSLVSRTWQPVPGYIGITGLDQTVVYDAFTNKVEFFRVKVWVME